MAFMPKGVAALPKPSIFAVRFIEIAPAVSEFFLRPGKINFSIGYMKAPIFSVRPDSVAILISPLHRQSIPRSFIASSTPLFPASMRAEDTADMFPKAAAAKKEKMIIAGQIMFIIAITPGDNSVLEFNIDVIT